MGFLNRIIVVPLLLLLSFAADAQLLNQKIKLQYFYPSLQSEGMGGVTAIVGQGVEFPEFHGGLVVADVSDKSIALAFSTPGRNSWFGASFNGLEFFDAEGSIPKITGVTLNPSSNMAGFDASRISFDEDHVWVNWQGLEFDTTMKVILDLQFENSPLSVPALGAWGLIALTLGVAFISTNRVRRLKS